MTLRKTPILETVFSENCFTSKIMFFYIFLVALDYKKKQFLAHTPFMYTRAVVRVGHSTGGEDAWTKRPSSLRPQ
jgi:hypothetical protein